MNNNDEMEEHVKIFRLSMTEEEMSMRIGHFLQNVRMRIEDILDCIDKEDLSKDDMNFLMPNLIMGLRILEQFGESMGVGQNAFTVGYEEYIKLMDIFEGREG